MRAFLFVFMLFASTLFGPTAWGQTFVSLEVDQTWVGLNDQRVPGNSGTLFSLKDFDDGPFAGYRVYLGHLFNGKHEVRGLYAPLKLDVSGQLNETTLFNGSTFAAGVPTNATYKFNSYRLTYAYHFDPTGGWELALGFTGKIRDAEVRLKQGSTEASKSNVGFVPLINFQAVRALSENWSFRFDVDALAAPQGRAIDAGLFVERRVNEALHLFTGYRTIEGGADNDEVYNMAWIHKAVLGLRGEF